jgi:hypothetical protein
MGKEAASRKHTNLSFIQYPAAARRFFPPNFPKALSSRIPTNRSLRRFGGMRDPLGLSRIFIKYKPVKNITGLFRLYQSFIFL